MLAPARAALVVLLLLSLPGIVPVLGARSQSAVTLSGRVFDSSGAAVPGASVTVAGPSLGTARTVFTDRTGRYEVPALAAGTYEVTVELSGFRPVTRQVALSAESGPLDVTIDLAGITESVIVRGERGTRVLRDTAASVVVYDDALLERRPLRAGTVDLMAQIPNVTTTGTNNFAPAIRGADGTGPAQGADAFFAGTRPRLNVQVDGRPASYNEVVFGDVGLWDVEQVEIFRGAQSTLQGRNAVAGTLVVRTKDPTYQPEGRLRVGVGNLGTRQISGMLSGPLVADRVAARIAFDRSTSESFVDGFSPFARVEQPGDFESLTVRGKVLVEPDAARRFSTLLTFNHAVSKGPQTESVLRPFGDRASSYPQMPVFEPTTTSAVVESRWTLNGAIAYEHTVAFTDLRVERKAVPGDGNATIDGRELVVEPRVRFSAAGARLQGVGGLYYFRGRQDEAIDLFGGGAFDDRTDTVAGFGELVLSMPRNVDLTVGGRLERERRDRSGSDGPFTIDFDETYTVFSPKVGVRWRATDRLTLGTVLSRGYNAGGAGFTYDFPFVSYTFAPEFVWSSETYLRADLRDNTVSVTANAFYSRYTDMQLPFDLNADPSIWSFVVRNADAAATYGAEFGLTWRALPGLELFGNLGLLRTKITDYPGSGVEGNELAQAPAATADVGALYRHPSGIDASIDARASDAYYSSVTNDPRGKTDPYGLVNGQVGYTLRGTRIYAFVHNLLDSDAPTLLEPGATTAGDVAVVLRPRRAGIGLTWGF